ncbi:amidase [uncultured Alsobacter sp.]|uniref:amidase n=1 Tax=uncultured Alsobacter sp. TaxID=1748258 RepID=UPI0025DA3238|nr:amidase [uncultured Alsobacter sp.]
MTSLIDLSAAELGPLYARRAVSPREVIDAVIAQIETCEPLVQALYAFDADGARAAADRSTVRWMRDEARGPLDGVPVTIKENIATQGVPVPLGCAATELTPATADAPPAQRLRDAGAVIFAKTTMPDLGMLTSGLSSFHPLARNPWNLDRNPGGSSAGAAAAGAVGYGPLHLGTDIGGSVRLPAAFCGLVGLKPSHGRVPIDPAYLGRIAGPLTRTVADTALMMATIAQPDWRDPTELPPSGIDWRQATVGTEGAVRGLRVGLMEEAGAGLPVAPAVAAALQETAAMLREAGAEIVPVRPILTRAMLDGLDDFWRVRAWDDVSKLPAERRALILPYIRQWAESGAARSGLEVMRGYNQTHAMRIAGARLFHDLDFVLSPTCPVVAWGAELASPVHDPEEPFEHIGFTVAWNMAENPAVSVNWSYDPDGMPIGMQVAGRRFDDLGVLRVAHLIETRRPAQRPWPTTPHRA